jgi:hypothetical protein
MDLTTSGLPFEMPTPGVSFASGRLAQPSDHLEDVVSDLILGPGADGGPIRAL